MKKILTPILAICIIACNENNHTNEVNADTTIHSTTTAPVVDTMGTQIQTDTTFHQDDIVESSAKNSKGDQLRMIFDNKAGNVKIHLNNGEEILLQQQIMGSGIRYTNDQYEFLGKGDHVTLKKDGKVIFEN